MRLNVFNERRGPKVEKSHNERWATFSVGHRFLAVVRTVDLWPSPLTASIIVINSKYTHTITLTHTLSLSLQTSLNIRGCVKKKSGIFVFSWEFVVVCLVENGKDRSERESSNSSWSSQKTSSPHCQTGLNQSITFKCTVRYPSCFLFLLLANTHFPVDKDSEFWLTLLYIFMLKHSLLSLKK